MNKPQDDWNDRRLCGIWVLAVATVMVIGLVPPVRARPWQAPAATDGAALFKTYCATCHDTTGTGNGPMARALRQAPADLTEISKRNGGMFPAARIRRIIDGRDVESHGDRDMPVWGDAFTTTRDGRSQTAAGARIAAIVQFLESIQRREAQ